MTAMGGNEKMPFSPLIEQAVSEGAPLLRRFTGRALRMIHG
jgi:hypothetical protein